MYGLRLGFADLAAARRPLAASLGGCLPHHGHLPISGGTTKHASVDLPAQSAGLDLGTVWLQLCHQANTQGAQFRPTEADTLIWHGQTGVREQAGQLRRRGLAATCCVHGDDVETLRLEASDTGGCALEWRSHDGHRPAGTPAAAAPLGLELHVHAPERTASYWATLLQAAWERDAGGLPLLRTAPLWLRFAPLRGNEAPGIAALLFSPDHAHRLAQHASACGVAVTAEDRWELQGLQIGPTRI